MDRLNARNLDDLPERPIRPVLTGRETADLAVVLKEKDAIVGRNDVAFDLRACRLSLFERAALADERRKGVRPQRIRLNLREAVAGRGEARGKRR